MWVSSTVWTTHFTSKSENCINPGEDIVVQRVQLLQQREDDLHEAKVKWFFCDPELDRKKDKKFDSCLPPLSLKNVWKTDFGKIALK